jgi:biopolymer transport protein ExbD
MDPLRLRVLLAAPLASLFLVLSLCTFVVRSPVAARIMVPLPVTRIVDLNECPDDRDIVVVITPDQLRINETPISLEDLRPLLRQIFENRVSVAAFILVEPGVSFSRFADVYSEMQKSDERLSIGIISRGLEEQAEHAAYGKAVRLVFRDHPEAELCAIAPVQPVKILPVR